MPVKTVTNMSVQCPCGAIHVITPRAGAILLEAYANGTHQLVTAEGVTLPCLVDLADELGCRQFRSKVSVS